jgi:hypothetical protein
LYGILDLDTSPEDSNLNRSLFEEAPSAVMLSTYEGAVILLTTLIIIIISLTLSPSFSNRKMASITGLYITSAFKFLQANCAYGNCSPVHRPRIKKTSMVFAKVRPPENEVTTVSSLVKVKE